MDAFTAAAITIFVLFLLIAAYYEGIKVAFGILIFTFTVGASFITLLLLYACLGLEI